jgi:hypothetical protein
MPAEPIWSEVAALGDPPSLTAGWDLLASTMSVMYPLIESSTFTLQIAEGIRLWSDLSSATALTFVSMMPLRFFSMSMVSALVG